MKQMIKNVSITTENNLCISCGVCTAVCPKRCISLKNKNGMNIPIIGNDCISCGICYQICPGKGYSYSNGTVISVNSKSFWLGRCIGIYTANTKDTKLRFNSVSGGVVTELVRDLLNEEDYKAAFLIDSHYYDNDNIVYTKPFSKEQDLVTTQKSRYLLVSHKKTVEYMLAHKEQKLIIVGTSCFVQALQNIIQKYKLNRNNYFIIGLFCDKTMSMNIVKYFSDYSDGKHGKLMELYFRTKEVGGWPGGVQLKYEDGKTYDLPNVERTKVKDWFQPERCLYCLDKLNQFADISVGDNYTGKNNNIDGSNSVIIRSEKGVEIWERYRYKFDIEESSTEDLWKSQHLDLKLSNYWFSKIKEKKVGAEINIGIISDQEIVPFSIKCDYENRLHMIEVGGTYAANPRRFKVILIKYNIEQKVKNRIKYFIRRIHSGLSLMDKI